MNKYTVTEKQDLQSTRTSVPILASNLKQAKRKATGLQMFQGTTLSIQDSSGALLAYKSPYNGYKWVDVDCN